MSQTREELPLFHDRGKLSEKNERKIELIRNAHGSFMADLTTLVFHNYLITDALTFVKILRGGYIRRTPGQHVQIMNYLQPKLLQVVRRFPGSYTDQGHLQNTEILLGTTRNAMMLIYCLKLQDSFLLPAIDIVTHECHNHDKIHAELKQRIPGIEMVPSVDPNAAILQFIHNHSVTATPRPPHAVASPIPHHPLLPFYGLGQSQRPTHAVASPFHHLGFGHMPFSPLQFQTYSPASTRQPNPTPPSYAQLLARPPERRLSLSETMSLPHARMGPSVGNSLIPVSYPSLFNDFGVRGSLQSANSGDVARSDNTSVHIPHVPETNDQSQSREARMLKRQRISEKATRAAAFVDHETDIENAVARSRLAQDER
jgi:hypothetical protein